MLRLSVLFSLVPLLAPAAVDFSTQIRPLLSENCVFCHGPDEKKREGDLRLDEEASAKANRDGVTAVVPGDPERSALIQRIVSTDPDEVMPPPKQHKKLSASEVALLKQWIKEGARWGGHWSYRKVTRPTVPQNGESHAVDAFLTERLKKEGLGFSPAADRATLVRRLALDLTGLPPTLDDARSLEVKEAIMRYLSLPAYGEHWARLWLDLARYADSSGYPSDQPREIWAYRDWVIRALNNNQPFDQFTIDQIAGDLLPKPTEEQIIATAFHRNTMTQNEGGTSDEEFRNAAVIDRVNTTMAVWMGTSMACAQCHTHKYDPITLKEYFQFYALLNQSADADKKDEAPLHEMWATGLKEKQQTVKAELAKLEAALNKPDTKWLAGLEEWAGKPHPELAKLKPEPKAVIAALAVAKAKRTPQQTTALSEYYVRNVSPANKPLRDQIAKMKKQVESIKPITVPIMKELQGKEKRVTRIQLRGNWQALDEEVQGAVPAVFHPLPADAAVDRLALARWLVHRDNPLTARVIMNRLWEQLFGVGIVRTSEEFGSQGELPVHPQLLDWLAAEFMESGWDMKHMIGLLVSSKAYQQVASVSPALQERDPENRLLARGPRFRTTGEMLRDQALAVSGLLSQKMYGPAVRPLAPSSGLTTAFGRGNDWAPSEGEDRHRRSLYTEVRRNAPYASFMTFDAGNREVCMLRRGRTNTPLQAFVTLNDPVFVECQQALARRVVSGAKDTTERIRLMFELGLARLPSDGEVKSMTQLAEETYASFKSDPAGALKLATDPLGPLPTGADAAELATWTTVANVFTNLDEFLMRP
jgi:hypothetical protein